MLALLDRVEATPAQIITDLHETVVQNQLAAASDLRAAVARRDHDAQSTALVARLRQASPEFVALWDTGDVAVRRGERGTGQRAGWRPLGE